MCEIANINITTTYASQKLNNQIRTSFNFNSHQGCSLQWKHSKFDQVVPLIYVRRIKSIGCTHIIEIKAQDMNKRSHGKISHTWKHLNHPTIVLPHLFSTWWTTLLLGSSRTFTKVVIGLRVMGETRKRHRWTNEV